MKLTDIPSAILHLPQTILDAVNKLRHRPVEGESIVGAASESRPYDSKSLISRRVSPLESTEPLINARANKQHLGELKARLCQDQKDQLALLNSTAQSDRYLELAADLTMVKCGLAKAGKNGITSLHAINDRISEEQLKDVERAMSQCVANPQETLRKSLPLPSGLVYEMLAAYGENSTQNPEEDIVLGDLLIADIKQFTQGETMNLEQYEGMMKDINRIKGLRTGTPAQRTEYLQLLSKNDNFAGTQLVDELEELLSPDRSEKRYQEVGRLMSTPSVDPKWRGTLEVLLWAADGKIER
ncbi:hypothetical protein EOPP23_06335 [Endozoicomonas sp. OPT23]|uniref:hypothetical protein n=1 Tax=Endozoicomonas sp. OPT23 TaxID=2072845 RepID=UPI00129B7B0B|nr:hypothetical protein [Endozoicomonas sp. OPT23]MRI32604.1 hypothetical protein [Endozoicomonas sp. OPT23]